MGFRVWGLGFRAYVFGLRVQGWLSRRVWLQGEVQALGSGAWAEEEGSGSTYSLHCSSLLGLPCRSLIIYLVKPKKGTTMETIGRVSG